MDKLLLLNRNLSESCAEQRLQFEIAGENKKSSLL